ncbi:G5 domain-containing protein [Anaerococcus vaginalis]|uniref:G5 domain-containing protein n=1 Tax=Anaerococcus vaginalis TaxID=33037 RepID=UPI0029035462|nr:G5 domain-containing protein [Anaerococcus vaginalis]MDU2374617.1 G5 domain-containing protein [Anaerococcus vaginalis]
MKKENKKKIIIPAAVLLSIGLFSRCSFLDGTDKTKDKKIDNKPSVVSDKLSSNLDYNSVDDSNVKSNDKKNENKKEEKEDNKKTKEDENKDNKTVNSIVNENKKVARANSTNNGTISGIVNTKKTGNSGNNYYKPSKPANPSKPVTPNKPSKPVNPSNPSQGGIEKPVEPEKPAKPDKPVTPDKPEKPEVKLVKSEVESKSEKRDYKGFMYIIKEDNTLTKGEERIEKEGVRGYTVYTMKRNKDTYSDGTIKYSDWTIENKQVVNPVSGIKVVGTKEDKPVTPDKPDKPEKPEVTVVSTEEESKTENKDFVDFSYDEFENQQMPKGETKIIEEGTKGYTTYTYSRTKTVYSDGTVKYSDWKETNKKVVAPVNGTKLIGTYVERERELGWQKEAAMQVAQDLIAFRASLGLTTNIHYDQTYAKMMGDNDTFGHYCEYNEVVARRMAGDDGSTVIEGLKNSPQHKLQMTYDSEKGYGQDWYIGAYDNGNYTYYSLYSVSKESQPIFDRYQKEHTKDTPDFPEEENPTPEPEKPVETPTEPKEESNKEEQPSTPAEPVVEEAKPAEEVKEEPEKVEETVVEEAPVETPAEDKTEEINKVKEAK